MDVKWVREKIEVQFFNLIWKIAHYWNYSQELSSPLLFNFIISSLQIENSL